MAAIPRFIANPARTYLTRTLYRAGRRQLTFTQVEALEMLASRDKWRIHEYAKALQVNPSTASRAADRLVDLGLAERFVDATDRRYTIVRASKAGRRTCTKIQRDRYALMQEVMATISDEERAVFVDLLDRVGQAMEQAAARRRRGGG